MTADLHPLRQPPELRGWRDCLLQHAPPPVLREQLPDYLKAVAHDFLARADHPLAADERDRLDRWYASADGQQTLAAITRRLWAQMSGYAADAMPAHDARHAMFKVPTASLEHMAAERVTGFERVGVIGALLHDHGRWAEERIFGGPGSSLLHARMSYLLGRELLADFELPPTLADQILLAALRHTSGAEPSDPMPLKLTVAADRDQLYGHEIALRLSHHAVNARGEYASFATMPDDDGRGLSVLDRLEFFLRNRLPGPLHALDAHVDAMRESLLDFLLIAETPDQARARFVDLANPAASATRRLAASKPLPAWLAGPDGFDARIARAEALRPPAGDAEAALTALLDVPDVAPSPFYRAAALAKLAPLSPAARTRLAGAFVHAERECRRDDARQRALLIGLRERESGDALVTTLAGLLLREPA